MKEGAQERYNRIGTKQGFLECDAGIIESLKFYHREHLQMFLTEKSVIVSEFFSDF